MGYGAHCARFWRSTMIIPGILFVLGLLCLIKGGDWFVDGGRSDGGAAEK